MKSNSKFCSCIAIYSRRNINSHFPGIQLIQCHDHISVTALDRTTQPNAENGIYYSSIFLCFQVIHNRHLTGSCNIQLTLHFHSPVIRIPHQIQTCTITMQFQNTGNSHAISSVVPASADTENPFFLFFVCQRPFQFFCDFQSCPFHQDTGRNPDSLNHISIKSFHFFTGHNLFHSFSSPAIISIKGHYAASLP